MFEDKATEMKRLVLNYVKNLQGMLDAAARITGTAPTASKTKTVVENGFPKLPRPFDPNNYNKKELENLYRDYIGSHYCTWFNLHTAHTTDIRLGVATERRTRQAPWARIKQDTLKYVDAEDLPRPDFVLDTPRGMKLELLREFFVHIAEREKTFELGQVFRFKYVEATRKGDQNGSDDEDHEISNEESGAGPTEGFSRAEPVEGSGGAEQTQPAAGAGPAQENPGATLNGNQPDNGPHTIGEVVTPAPPPIPNAATVKKTKKTPAPAKQMKSRKNAGGPSGTQSTDPQRAPSTKKKKPKVTANQPASTHPAVGAVGAGVLELAPRLHPKPRPKPRPVTHPLNASNNEFTARDGEGTSNQAQGAHNNLQLPTQPQERVPQSAIDPSLLAASHQPGRALVNTSDNLALQEASRFAVKGKRVPKKKQQV